MSDIISAPLLFFYWCHLYKHHHSLNTVYTWINMSRNNNVIISPLFRGWRRHLVLGSTEVSVAGEPSSTSWGQSSDLQLYNTALIPDFGTSGASGRHRPGSRSSEEDRSRCVLSLLENDVMNKYFNPYFLSSIYANIRTVVI